MAGALRANDIDNATQVARQRNTDSCWLRKNDNNSLGRVDKIANFAILGAFRPKIRFRDSANLDLSRLGARISASKITFGCSFHILSTRPGLVRQQCARKGGQLATVPFSVDLHIQILKNLNAFDPPENLPADALLPKRNSSASCKKEFVAIQVN